MKDSDYQYIIKQDPRRMNEDREAKREIIVFAEEVLTKSDFNLVEDVYVKIISGNEKCENEAIDYLLKLVPARPKRVLFYVHCELRYGKAIMTRYVITYLGAFLNMGLNFLAKDLGGFRRFNPFGSTLKKISGKIPADLYDKLEKYNKIFYCPAKHDFESINNDDHLYSLRDAMYCCFVTMNIYRAISPLLNGDIEDRFNMASW